jgi:hypothetical protein
MTVLQTEIGPATVLHRLAVAVEARDALSNRLVDSVVTARYRRMPTATNPTPHWQPMNRRGTARFTLRHQLNATTPLPDLQLVIEDPSRRYVPRRFTITPWQLADVAESAPYVEPFARLLRIWLLPGSAYPLPGTATVIRGRVIQNGQPKRWARIQGTTPTSDAGWTHSDERGEFVLPILDAGADLTRVTTDQITVTLRVIGTPTIQTPPPPATDRTDDLVSEVIPRSTNPATTAELDNDVLRGIAVPAGYRENAAPPVRKETIPVSTETRLTTDVVFVPQP